jgi:hypothetical protein
MEVINDINENRELFSDDQSNNLSHLFRTSIKPDSSFGRADSKLDFRDENENTVSMIHAPQSSQMLSAPIHTFDFTVLESELNKIESQSGRPSKVTLFMLNTNF